jgi:hypothetical protein
LKNNDANKAAIFCLKNDLAPQTSIKVEKNSIEKSKWM